MEQALASLHVITRLHRYPSEMSEYDSEVVEGIVTKTLQAIVVERNLKSMLHSCLTHQRYPKDCSKQRSGAHEVEDA